MAESPRTDGDGLNQVFTIKVSSMLTKGHKDHRPLWLLKELLMQLQTIDSEAGFMADSTNTNAVPMNTSLRASLANSLSIKLSDPDQIPESDTPTGAFAKKYFHE
jgi:hypothetical protein